MVNLPHGGPVSSFSLFLSVPHEAEDVAWSPPFSWRSFLQSRFNFAAGPFSPFSGARSGFSSHPTERIPRFLAEFPSAFEILGG